MSTKALTPTFKKDGLVFWPIPDINDATVAFGLPESAYFKRTNLPRVPEKYTRQAMNLFYSGGKIDLPSDVPSDKATRYLRALLSSFRPSHESKEATAGYALWCWSKECTNARLALKERGAL